jgi:hypothetical protein
VNPTNQPKKEGKKKKKEKRKGLEGSENNGLGKKHVFIYFRVNREATCVSSSFARQQTSSEKLGMLTLQHHAS